MDPTKLPKIWHPQQEKILKTWGEAAACYRYMNYQAYLKYKQSSMHFTLPVIVLSTITGTANFAQEQFGENLRPYVAPTIGGLNLIAGLIATIMQFLKINELMESHRVSSMQYGKLSRTIRLELSLPLEERAQHGSNMIDQCRAEYDRLIEQSPTIPKDVLEAFDKEFPDDNKFFKPEIMHVQPIQPFKAILENSIVKRLSSQSPPLDPNSKRELEKELATIRGMDNYVKSTFADPLERSKTIAKSSVAASVPVVSRQPREEASSLEGSGLVARQRQELMKELQKKTDLLEVVTEVPKDDEQDK